MPNFGNQVIGRVGKIFPTTDSEVQGKHYFRRILWLDMTRIDQWTGERSFENWCEIEFSGDENCAELNKFKVGDIVRVNIEVMGRPYRYPDDHPDEHKRGVPVIFNTIRGRQIELRVIQHRPESQTSFYPSITSAPQPTTVPESQSSSMKQNEKMLDMYTDAKNYAQQKFPPEVDGNGIPQGDSSDLPF